MGFPFDSAETSFGAIELTEAAAGIAGEIIQQEVVDRFYEIADSAPSYQDVLGHDVLDEIRIVLFQELAEQFGDQDADGDIDEDDLASFSENLEQASQMASPMLAFAATKTYKFAWDRVSTDQFFYEIELEQEEVEEVSPEKLERMAMMMLDREGIATDIERASLEQLTGVLVKVLLKYRSQQDQRAGNPDLPTYDQVRDALTNFGKVARTRNPYKLNVYRDLELKEQSDIVVLGKFSVDVLYEMKKEIMIGAKDEASGKEMYRQNLEDIYNALPFGSDNKLVTVMKGVIDYGAIPTGSAGSDLDPSAELERAQEDLVIERNIKMLSRAGVEKFMQKGLGQRVGEAWEVVTGERSALDEAVGAVGNAFTEKARKEKAEEGIGHVLKLLMANDVLANPAEAATVRQFYRYAFLDNREAVNREYVKDLYQRLGKIRLARTLQPTDVAKLSEVDSSKANNIMKQDTVGAVLVEMGLTYSNLQGVRSDYQQNQHFEETRLSIDIVTDEVFKREQHELREMVGSHLEGALGKMIQGETYIQEQWQNWMMGIAFWVDYVLQRQVPDYKDFTGTNRGAFLRHTLATVGFGLSMYDYGGDLSQIISDASLSEWWSQSGWDLLEYPVAQVAAVADAHMNHLPAYTYFAVAFREAYKAGHLDKVVPPAANYYGKAVGVVDAVSRNTVGRVPIIGRAAGLPRWAMETPPKLGGKIVGGMNKAAPKTVGAAFFYTGLYMMIGDSILDIKVDSVTGDISFDFFGDGSPDTKWEFAEGLVYTAFGLKEAAASWQETRAERTKVSSQVDRLTRHGMGKDTIRGKIDGTGGGADRFRVSSGFKETEKKPGKAQQSEGSAEKLTREQAHLKSVADGIKSVDVSTLPDGTRRVVMVEDVKFTLSTRRGAPNPPTTGQHIRIYYIGNGDGDLVTYDVYKDNQGNIINENRSVETGRTAQQNTDLIQELRDIKSDYRKPSGVDVTGQAADKVTITRKGGGAIELTKVRGDVTYRMEVTHTQGKAAVPGLPASTGPGGEVIPGRPPELPVPDTFTIRIENVTTGEVYIEGTQTRPHGTGTPIGDIDRIHNRLRTYSSGYSEDFAFSNFEDDLLRRTGHPAGTQGSGGRMGHPGGLNDFFDIARARFTTAGQTVVLNTAMVDALINGAPPGGAGGGPGGRPGGTFINQDTPWITDADRLAHGSNTRPTFRDLMRDVMDGFTTNQRGFVDTGILADMLEAAGMDLDDPPLKRFMETLQNPESQSKFWETAKAKVKPNLTAMDQFAIIMLVFFAIHLGRGRAESYDPSKTTVDNFSTFLGFGTGLATGVYAEALVAAKLGSKLGPGPLGKLIGFAVGFATGLVTGITADVYVGRKIEEKAPLLCHYGAGVLEIPFTAISAPIAAVSNNTDDIYTWMNAHVLGVDFFNHFPNKRIIDTYKLRDFSSGDIEDTLISPWNKALDVRERYVIELLEEDQAKIDQQYGDYIASHPEMDLSYEDWLAWRLEMDSRPGGSAFLGVLGTLGRHRREKLKKELKEIPERRIEGEFDEWLTNEVVELGRAAEYVEALRVRAKAYTRVVALPGRASQLIERILSSEQISDEVKKAIRGAEANHPDATEKIADLDQKIRAYEIDVIPSAPSNERGKYERKLKEYKEKRASYVRYQEVRNTKVLAEQMMFAMPFIPVETFYYGGLLAHEQKEFDKLRGWADNDLLSEEQKARVEELESVIGPDRRLATRERRLRVAMDKGEWEEWMLANPIAVVGPLGTLVPYRRDEYGAEAAELESNQSRSSREQRRLEFLSAALKEDKTARANQYLEYKERMDGNIDFSGLAKAEMENGLFDQEVDEPFFSTKKGEVRTIRTSEGFSAVENLWSGENWVTSKDLRKLVSSEVSGYANSQDSVALRVATLQSAGFTDEHWRIRSQLGAQSKEMLDLFDTMMKEGALNGFMEGSKMKTADPLIDPAE